MANFKTHITVSTLLGAGYGVGGYLLGEVPIPSCILAGGLCSVSGMLADLDSGPGVPLRESMAFAAAVIPMMLVPRFESLGWPSEIIILAGAAVYLLVRFGLAELLKRYTVHRGMFHSLPAAIIFGQVAFLLSPGEDLNVRFFKAGAVVLGYVSHLLLDELYSLEWYKGRFRLKSSFGSAIKLLGSSMWANVSTFGKLALLTWLCLREPNWVAEYQQRVAWRQSRPAAEQSSSDDAASNAETIEQLWLDEMARQWLQELLMR